MRRILLPVLIALIAMSAGPVAQVFAGVSDPRYYSVQTIALGHGVLLDRSVIKGPPNPPPGYQLERAPVALPKPDLAAQTNILTGRDTRTCIPAPPTAV